MSNRKLPLDDKERDVSNVDRTDFDKMLKVFVSKNFLTLYNKDYELKSVQSVKPLVENDSKLEADCYCQTPAFERFLVSDPRSLCQKFFQDVKIGDLVFGRIEHVSSFDLSVRLLCSAGGFERDLEDLKILGRLPIDECVSLEMRRDDFVKDTLIRACVHSFDDNEKTIRLTFQMMPNVTIRLGIIRECDLPSFFRNDDYDRDFDKFLKSERNFDNPSSVDLLCQRLGLSIFNNSTLFQSIRSVDYSSEKRAGYMRKVQTHNLAMKSVERGVEKLRSDESLVAMQHFNKALQIEGENVEALVARGALFANKESFDLAIQDFRTALTHQPDHRNAKIYLIETLIAQSKVYRREEKWRKAKKCLESILEIDANNAEALGMLELLANSLANSANSSTRKVDKSKAEVISLDPSIVEKYGVDRKTFKDPDFLSKFDQYRQKFDKRHSSGSNNDHEIIDLTSGACSSKIIDRPKLTAKRKFLEHSERQENRTLSTEPTNSIGHRSRCHNNSISKNNCNERSRTNMSQRDSAPEANGQWKKDLKRMEDFINVLKTKKK